MRKEFLKISRKKSAIEFTLDEVVILETSKPLKNFKF